MIKRVSILSTKANTLLNLEKFLRKSKVEKTFAFTYYYWVNHQDHILNKIQNKFGPEKIVVRSSAMSEDTESESLAGQFQSILNVDSTNKEKIKDAIEKVFDSYRRKKSTSLFNQAFIQSQTKNVLISGVVFTRGLLRDSPYYIINYDSSGSTDSVTSGLENRTIKISKFLSKKHIPLKFRKLIDSVKEIEKVIPKKSLDIEFAINGSGEVVIFQVRPITTKKINIKDISIEKRILNLKKQFERLSFKNKYLEKEKKIFADMPDWNPAEILGDNPGYLDYSLYDYIITKKAWHDARVSQGYDAGKSSKLVFLFGNKPYVDVHASFRSFIPDGLSENLRKKLILFFMEKLRKKPELQDKVEFDILYTCYDFNFRERSEELLNSGFSESEVLDLKNALIKLTNKLIRNYKKEIIKDLKSIEEMKKNRKKIKVTDEHIVSSLKCAKNLLDDCRNKATVQFSRMARLAFVGKSLLKSLTSKEIISKKMYDCFLESIKTVATEFEEDFQLMGKGKISKDKFIKKYYHLRPGTYDITSKRYESNIDLIKPGTSSFNIKPKKQKFILDKSSENKINDSLKKEDLLFNAKDLFSFIKESIEAREFFKFEFTKNLSDSIELIALAGKEMGFSREELSFLGLQEIFAFKYLDKKDLAKLWKLKISENMKIKEINDHLELPPIIFSSRNFEIVAHYISRPNFITSKKIDASLYLLNKNNSKTSDIKGRIIMIESGDPGYDWIFTKNPAGLITKYGGAASHMAIRCAEFGIPAAIGCGVLFDKLKSKRKISLDCKFKKIVSLEVE